MIIVCKFGSIALVELEKSEMCFQNVSHLGFPTDSKLTNFAPVKLEKKLKICFQGIFKMAAMTAMSDFAPV